MIESVQARHRGAFNFEDHYDNLCALQDSAPLPAVKAHLAQGVIDLNGDRVRLNDWQPIINTLRINKSLQFVALRSYYQMPQEEDEKRAAILRRKLPSIRSKEITHRLVKALKECLMVSPCLSCIELQGLSLRDRDLQMLVKGILKSNTLRHLSLEFCRIGDQGLEILCKGLKNSKHINSVNLSGCSLSYRGAEYLAAVIKHQGMQRHNEAWRDSLRYRRPDLDRMSGLRRITANANPMLGDQGARAFAEALKDDLWLKALDLQACGIGAMGARSFLEVLKYNTTLVVLDLRRNPLIERDLLHSVMEQLMLNSSGEDGEYKWMSENPIDHRAPPRTQTSAGKPRRRTTKVLNSSLGKKTTIKVTPKSTRRSARTTGYMGRREVAPSPGLPWRTAARANRFRGHPPDAAATTSYLADQSSDLSTSMLYTSAAAAHGDDGEDDDSASELVVEVNGPGGGGVKVDAVGRAGFASSKRRETEAAMQKLEESHLSLDLSNSKEVRIELEQMRRHLREERLARAKSDQRVVQLMIENRHLTEEVSRLKKGQSGARLAEDESFLESVEASFKQFHAFIDMLREAGMGQLVTMAGLDQSAMPFATNGSSDYISSNSSGGNGIINKNSHHHHRYPAASLNTNNNNMSSDNNNDDDDGGGGRGGVAGHNTTYANMPLASSAFVTSRQQQQRSSPGDPLPSRSMMASFTEGDPVLIGSHGAGTRGDPPAVATRSTRYEDESDAARQEADELYSRLVQETRGALGRPDGDFGTGAKVTTATTGSPAARPVASVNIARALAEAGPAGRAQDGWTEGRSGGSVQQLAQEERLRQEDEAESALHSPDKSAASLVEEELEEEEPSSPGISGRGQDDSGAGLQATAVKDLDSADEDF